MAGPIGLKFFVDTHGWLEGISQKIKNFISEYFFSIFFHGQRRGLQLIVLHIKAWEDRSYLTFKFSFFPFFYYQNTYFHALKYYFKLIREDVDLAQP